MGVGYFLQIFLFECDMASQSAGDPSQHLHLTDSPGDGGTDVELGAGGAVYDLGQASVSPLTFGKVFGAITRVTAVNTPNINDRIAKRWGLPEVASSVKFKKIYSDGRATMR